MRKSPVLEWQIPKRIFVAEDGSGLNAFGTLLERAIEAA